MKTCTKCNIEKPFYFFHKSKYSKDGYFYNCKECKENQQNKYNEQNKYCKVDFLIIKIKENSIKKKKLSEGIRTLIYGSLKRGKNNFKKTNKTEQILGCTIEEFKIYIQSNFKKGMSFENRNEWHLDHIIPISTAISYDDVIRLNHYTNFQPLWAKENLSKGAKIIETQLKLL